MRPHPSFNTGEEARHQAPAASKSDDARLFLLFHFDNESRCKTLPNTQNFLNPTISAYYCGRRGNGHGAPSFRTFPSATNFVNRQNAQT